MSGRKVIIAGASGLVGGAALERFLNAGEDWDVVALSRRPPDPDSSKPFEHIVADLRDRDACAAALRDVKGVTHIVYATLFEKAGLVPGWFDKDYLEINTAMLKNLMESLPASEDTLENVSIMQGTKAYGFHLGPMDIPARERSPRHPHENFYWEHEDYIKARGEQRGFTWTVLRPHLIVGGSVGVSMNLPPVIGAYGAICRELGLDFGFPGGPAPPWEAVDVRVVAGALLWAATAPTAANEIFNIVNGEVFDWRALWPTIATTLGLPPAEDTPRQLATFLPEHADVWDRIVEKHDLQKISLEDLLGESHHLVDLVFAYGMEEPPPAAYVSAIKIRQAGFNECYDAEQMWTYWLQRLIDKRYLPPADAPVASLAGGRERSGR
jgi:nucleoside-diphosphate-sugar epimerase